MATQTKARLSGSRRKTSRPKRRRTTGPSVPHIALVLRAAGIKPYYSSDDGSFVLIRGDCLVVLPALISAGLRANLVFADPPYLLSNGGTTCKSGKRVSVNKGDWDKSSGIEADHEFAVSWLRQCLASLAPGGTLWVSATHHAVYSIGYSFRPATTGIIFCVRTRS